MIIVIDLTCVSHTCQSYLSRVLSIVCYRACVPVQAICRLRPNPSLPVSTTGNIQGIIIFTQRIVTNFVFPYHKV